MDIFSYVFTMCKFTEVWRLVLFTPAYTKGLRGRRQATSLLRLSEAKRVPGQIFSTNFNILKAAPICTCWRRSKGAVFVAIAERGSGKHQSWLHADTGTKREYSFFWLFARRHPTHNLKENTRCQSGAKYSRWQYFWNLLFYVVYKPIQGITVCIYYVLH